MSKKKGFIVSSKWAKVFEEDIKKDFNNSEFEEVQEIEKADRIILYGLPYNSVRAHISEVKGVGITEETLKKLRKCNGEFNVKQVSDNGVYSMGRVSDYWFDIDEIKAEETKTDKGRRIEREAYDISSRVWGKSKVEIVNDNYGKDPFGFIDLMILDPLKFIQVKSNGLNKKKYKRIISRNFNLDKYDLEVWVREDYKGWIVYDIREEDEVTFSEKAKTESCDKDELVKILRKDDI